MNYILLKARTKLREVYYFIQIYKANLKNKKYLNGTFKNLVHSWEPKTFEMLMKTILKTQIY